MVLRAAAQAGIVVLLARQLGAQPYGQFVAVIAVASFFGPFVGLGLSNIVLRNGARDPAHEAIYLARAMQWWARTLLPCTAVAIAVALLLLPRGLPVIAICAVIGAELLAASFTELRSRHRQAQQKTNAYGAINAGLPGIRLIAFGVLFVFTDYVNTAAVLWTYACASLVYTFILWLPMPSECGAPDSPAHEPMSATSGLPFSLAAFAMKLQGEFNKPVLAQSGFGLAGTYNVAQRAVEMASLPLLALQESLWPRLYSQLDPMKQLVRTGLALLAVALLLGAIVWTAAPLLPLLLGEGFTESVGVLRMLAWLPLLQASRLLLNFHAIHHNRMNVIGWAYAAGGVVSVLSVLILVPRLGMTGAVISSYASEAAMITYLISTMKRST